MIAKIKEYLNNFSKTENFKNKFYTEFASHIVFIKFVYNKAIKICLH